MKDITNCIQFRLLIILTSTAEFPPKVLSTAGVYGKIKTRLQLWLYIYIYIFIFICFTQVDRKHVLLREIPEIEGGTATNIKTQKIT